MIYGKGNFSPTMVFVGEAPTQIEARMKDVFRGNGGKLLQAVCNAVGISMKEVFLTNVMNESYVGKQPTVAEIKKHAPRLWNDLQELQPKVIVAMGTHAFKTLIGGVGTIGDVRGYTYWSRELKCYIIPTFHPNAVVYNPGFFDDFAKDIDKAAKARDLPAGGIKEKPIQWITVRSTKRAERILKSMLRMRNVVSCDIETDGFDYWTQDILSIGFSTSDNSAIIFGKDIIENQEILDLLIKVMSNPNIIWVYQNGKFDTQYMRAPIKPELYEKTKNIVIPTARCDYDTMLAHYCIDERTGTHGLKLWARELFDAPDWEADIKKYLPNSNTPYSTIPVEVMHKYQAYDVVYTRKGYYKFNELMQTEETLSAFQNLLMPASRALAEIELYGVLVDVKKLKETAADATPKIEEARKRLEKEAEKIGWSPKAFVAATGSKTVPQQFNPKSYPQLQWVAYDLCKMPLFEGKKTCGKDAVEIYQYRHPFWKALAEYKQVADLFGTYVKGMLQRVDKDNRIRPDFLLHGTVTGRLSCHNPNLQNIPRKSFVKKLFIAPEDSVIVSVDYKTLEVVVASILSGDPEMQRPFIEGIDFHMETTKDVFGEDLKRFKEWSQSKDIDSYIKYLQRPMMLEMRRPDAALQYIYDWTDKDDTSSYKLKPIAEIKFDKLEDIIVDYLRFLTKFITFGIMYGRKALSLAHGELNCSVSEAQNYIDNFHKKYEVFSKWIEAQENQAITKRYVTNPFGRKRRWSLITNDNIFSVKNQAVNTPIQGTASDICLMAATRLHNMFKEDGYRLGHVLWLVHDAINFEIKKVHLQEALTVIQKEMTKQVLDTKVPLNVDLEIGPSYGEVEKVKFENGRWIPAKDTASDFVKKVLHN